MYKILSVCEMCLEHNNYTDLLTIIDGQQKLAIMAEVQRLT